MRLYIKQLYNSNGELLSVEESKIIIKNQCIKEGVSFPYMEVTYNEIEYYMSP